MYIRMKALQKTCFSEKKKKMNMKKRSFNSDQLWLCSPLHLALHFLTTRQENRTGQLHVIAPYLSLYWENGYYLTMFTSGFQFHFQIVQCNKLPFYFCLFVFFSFFPTCTKLVSEYFQNRIEQYSHYQSVIECILY